MSEREGLTLERSSPLPARARRAPPAQDLPAARAWLALSLGTLLLAGLTAVLLVVGRLLPLLGVTSGGGFFRRCLVVHVDLALVVWFYAFLAGLVALLPCRRPAGGLSRAGAGVAALGVLLLLVGMFNPDAAPILCNYVPVLDHPQHLVALGAIALGLVLALADGRLLPGREAPAGPVPVPPAARVGLRAAGVAVLLALATLVASVAATPDGFLPDARWELVFWGPGHVLQAASACAMAAAWILLLTPALGEAPVGRGAASALFAVLVAPLLAGPLLAARGPADIVSHTGFTQLMRWGIAPALLVLLVLCARAVARARRDGRLPGLLADARVAGFVASASLTVLGVCLGAAISGSNTVIPAHYHASVGGVTASFMALTYLLLEPLGAPIPARLRPLTRWQPLVYGAGQVVFAIGFAFSGLYGLARKAYGAEQVVRTTSETVGLAVMGLGGLVAVAGGALFITIVGAAWRARAAAPAQEEVVA
ncbi:MAG: hypothetical protein M9894_06170 [Planctomycetes bacterium]|nr:hypothetical protein [Planctomycetota bacterium]